MTSEAVAKLLPRADYRNGSYYFKHGVDVLLENDLAELSSTLLALRGSGILTGNEFRRKLG